MNRDAFRCTEQKNATFRPWSIAVGAGALEASLHVGAGSVSADANIRAFVHVHTARPASVQHESARTRTTKRAVRVDTIAAL